MKNNEIDQNEDDINDNLEISTEHRLYQEQKSINIDIPSWVIDALDKEATRIGITRNAIIKVWLADRVQQESANNKRN